MVSDFSALFGSFRTLPFVRCLVKGFAPQKRQLLLYMILYHINDTMSRLS